MLLDAVLSFAFLSIIVESAQGGFADDLLRKHNELRNIHSSDYLALDTELSQKAQQVADKAAQTGEFGNAEPGMNTYMACATFMRGLKGEEVTEAWYNGVCDKDFSFDKPKNEKSNAFTQLVWKDTKFIGVGVSNATKKDNNGNKCKFVVVEYRPPGNVEDKPSDVQTFVDNVGKGRFDEKYCDNINSRKRKKRSIYYRFPVRFFIDPMSGQTKRVTALGDPQRKQMSSKSLLPSTWYTSSSYGISPYIGLSPRPYSSINGAVSYPEFTAPYPVMNKNEISSDYYLKERKTEETSKRDIVTNEALTVHNILRRIHDSPDLVIDDEMSAQAEAVAQENLNANRMKHSSNLRQLGQGENLAYNCPASGEAKIGESVKDWYNEVCTENYNFDNKSPSSSALHFTQLVWKKTTKLGCGSAVGDVRGMRCSYFCCRYKVAGNMQGDFLENVKRGSFTRDICDKLDKIINSGGGETTGKQPQNNTGTDQKPAQPKPEEEETNKPKPQAPTEEPCTAKPSKPVQTQPSNPTSSNQQNLDETNYQHDSIMIMNKFRSLHEAEPLQPDENLQSEAKKIAEDLVSNKGAWTRMKDKLRDRSLGIYQVSCNPLNKVMPPEEAMSNWYREACTKTINYDLANEESLAKAPHFTQMVWKASEKVGIAYATKTKPQKRLLCTVVVAKFDPPGNTGEFSKNVAKGSFDKSFCGSIQTIASSATEDNPQITQEPSETSQTNGTEPQFGGKPSETGQEVNPQPEAGNPQPETGNPQPEAGNPQPEAGNPQPEAGNPQPETGNPQPETGKPQPEAGNPQPETGNPQPEAGNPQPETGNPQPEAGNPQPETGNPQPETGSPQPETGSPQPETGSPQPETGNPKPETGNPKPEIGNPQSETGCSQPKTGSPQPKTGNPRPKTGCPQPKKGKTVPETRNPKPDAPAPDYPQHVANENDYSAGTGSEYFNQQALFAHNQFRKIHGVPPMTLDPQMSSEAAAYAQYLAQIGTLIHKKNIKYGENLAMICTNDNSKYTGDEAVSRWYDEVCEFYYNFGSGGFSGSTGHFTQVVWKESVKLGIGYAKVPSRRFSGTCHYVVGRYSPAGNSGRYNENVPRGSFNKQTICPNVKKIAKEGNGNQPVDNANQPADNANQPADNANQPTDNANQPTDNANQPADNANQPTDNANQPADNANQPTDNANQPADNANQPTDNANQPIDNANEPADNSNQPADNTNQPPDNANQPDDFAQQALNAHNKFRAYHDAPPMTLNDGMVQAATQYAQALARLGTLRHSGKDENPLNDGENLAYYCSSNLQSYTGDAPVKAWYDEVCKPGYNFNSGGFSSGTGHFTQVVWKKSVELGIGKATSKEGYFTCIYTVGRYREAGNFNTRAQFQENVKRGKFTPSICGNTEQILTSKRALPSISLPINQNKTISIVRNFKKETRKEVAKGVSRSLKSAEKSKASKNLIRNKSAKHKI